MAERVGNFGDYYKFHSVESRIKQIPFDMITDSQQSLLVLDVGCNSGDLTEEIYSKLSNSKNVNILAIDIDDALIKKAKDKNKCPKGITYQKLNFMQEEERKSVINNFLFSHNAEKFDIVFCFSITMWIHLNHGDSGLEKFLHSLSEMTNLLLIEPQPWKCYQTAVRRAKRLGLPPYEYFTELKMRSNIQSDINNILQTKCRMVLQDQSHRNEWDRTLSLYKKTSNP